MQNGTILFFMMDENDKRNNVFKDKIKKKSNCRTL